MKLLEAIKAFALEDRRFRFRPRRSHYASSALADRRDSYREWKGEPKSNPVDFIGRLRMFMGTAVEEALVKHWLGNLHRQGHHVLASQVQVGESNPNWDGNMDVLMEQRLPDGTFHTYVVEIKTKSGYGADLLMKDGVPSDEYLIQLGLYLRRLSAEKVTNYGCLFYMLLSDNNFGKLLQFNCRYDEATGEVICYEYTNSDGFSEPKDIRYSLVGVDKRWLELEEALKANKCPKPDYVYKYPLTEEMLSGLSDNMVRRMANNEKVIGDWQASYSGYKDINAKEDGTGLGYTASEIAVIKEHYRKRHPKSKI